MSATPTPKLTETGADDFEDIVDSPYAQGGPTGGLLDGEGDDANLAEEEFVIENAGSKEDDAFDRAVEALQEISISEEFQDVLKKFCAENCHHFEDTEENKLIYMDIFKSYSALIEGHLEEKMKAAIKGFSMEEFLEELAKRGEGEIDLAVFDLLISLADFDTFKQQMLDCGSRSSSLAVTGVKSQMHEEDDEDGEVRKDLEDLLVIAPASPSGAKGRPK
eukprot:TRINITY_DN62918_c0_g1_i1.p1 TRINITY_DN62918_c0_g1~~TRINITY_DN62918_c0_g1_i1.p1  ORF type:complete len:220 (-),score=65.02 TRINITY_DN62918_c0_g1_i1:105-764(-)